MTFVQRIAIFYTKGFIVDELYEYVDLTLMES